MKILNGDTNPILKCEVGSGGATKGDMVVISSGAVVKAAAAPSAATIIGIALETGAQGAFIDVMQIKSGTRIRSEYTGSSKTSLADTDLLTAFDLTDANTVNLDDTTGGPCVCIGYDNNNDTIDFMVPASLLYL